MIWYNKFTMNLTIAGQYKYLAKEQEKIKRMIEKNDQKLILIKKYLEHTRDVAKARDEIKRGKVIPQENLFRELGF